MDIYTRSLTIVYLFIAVFLQQIFTLQAGSAEKIPLTGPLGFIENKGQFLDQQGQPRNDVLYMYQRQGLKVQLLSNTISFELYTMEDDKKSVEEATGFARDYNLDPEDRPSSYIDYKSSRIDIEFIGANLRPQIIAEEVYSDYLNYYLAHTPAEGITQVNHYNRITYRNLYKNIDLVLVAQPEGYSTRTLAYDFVVHPGGNVNQIRYRYHGSKGQQLYENGTMETATSSGKIFEMIPESYLQNAQGMKLLPVSVSFKKEKGVISFEAAHYDKKQSLVIDPVFVWATYCGGLYSEEGRGLAVDSQDNIIVVGRTYSPNNIATDGAYQTQIVGEIDVLVEKYNNNGGRIWGTYYGGSGLDRARAVIVNEDSDIFLGCHTTSPDGCTTPFAYREYFSGVEDGLLARFTSTGYRLWATYYGGDDEDIIRRLALDPEGDILMVGYTFSDTGIATPDAYQPDYHGSSDLCLSKWTEGGDLMWGTYLGGEHEDHGRSVKTDDFGNIYVNGSTTSLYGIAKNAYKDHIADKQDFLLAKFGHTGSCKWSTYWGGEKEDRGRGVYVNPTGEYVYFAGYSASDTGVATPGAYQEHWVANWDSVGQNQGKALHDMVVMKWTEAGEIVWSTYLGGLADDRGRAITMIDEDVYVGGTTQSPTTMSTPDGFQPVISGGDDMFLEKFDASGNRIWGSYFGEEGNESLLALAVDLDKVHMYMVGTTSSIDIATPGTAQTVYGGYDDVLLLKVNVVNGVSVNTPQTESTLSIYPDPNMGEFSVKFRIQQEALLTIYDLNGKVIYTRNIHAAEQKISVQDLKALPGLYSCVLSVDGNVLASTKLVIVK